MKSALRIIQAADNRLNPIVVKEMRQLVQSRWVLSIIMLFLLVILGTMAIFAINSSAEIDTYTTQTLTVGRRSFLILAMIFSVTCMFFIPAYTAMRLSNERSWDGMDLLYVTTLTPAAIIRGKFQAGILLCILILSVSLPFMVLCYFLRGIDLPTMAFAIFICILCVIVVNQASLFVACLPVQKVFKFLLGIGSLLLVFWITAGLYTGLRHIINLGYEGIFQTGDAWWPIASFVLLTLLVTGLFYRLCVALISPQSMDRAFGLRVYVAAMWGLSLILTIISTVFIYSPRGYGNGAVLTWYVLSLLGVMIGLLASISENENRSARVTASIPHNTLLHKIAFFFYCGPANGIAWCATIAVCTALVPLLFQLGSGKDMSFYSKNAAGTMGILTLYAFGYAISALFLRRLIGRFFKRFSAKFTWLVCLLLVVAGGLYFYIFWLVFYWSDNNNMMYILERKFKPLDFINVITNDHTAAHLYTALVWLLLLLIPFGRWFVQQARRFIPPVPAASDTAQAQPITGTSDTPARQLTNFLNHTKEE